MHAFIVDDCSSRPPDPRGCRASLRVTGIYLRSMAGECHLFILAKEVDPQKWSLANARHSSCCMSNGINKSFEKGSLRGIHEFAGLYPITTRPVRVATKSSPVGNRKSVICISSMCARLLEPKWKSHVSPSPKEREISYCLVGYLRDRRDSNCNF